nr:polysaccharide biosynthesis protein [Alicyclobacillus sp. SO9]
MCYNAVAFFNREVCATHKPSLTRGATAMVASMFITKVLGLVYVIPLTYLIHKDGLGLYSSAYALYSLLLTVSIAGFPTAMARTISERLALNRYGDVEQLFRLTSRLMIGLGAVSFLLMWFGAPLYSRLIGLKASGASLQSVTLSVRAVAPSLLIIPVMSSLRGYLQGFQRMEPSGLSQAVEQLFRVVAIVLGAYLVVKVFAPGNIAVGAAAATFGSFVGGAAALWLLILAVQKLKKDLGNRRFATPTESSSKAIKTLWKYAVPVSMGALVLPVSIQVDALTIPNLLSVLKHLSWSNALGQYGIYSRQAVQLVSIPMAFVVAIGSSIMPAIAHAQTRRDLKTINHQMRRTLRTAFFLLFPIAAVLLLLAKPIDMALFDQQSGVNAIASVSVMSIFSGFEMITTYMLQGVGKMYRPVRNMFIGLAVKLVFNFILIGPLGIVGAAMASTLGYLVSSTLNIMAVKKYAELQFSVWNQVLPSLVATVLTGILTEVLYAFSLVLWHPVTNAHAMIWAWIQLLFILFLSGLFYLFISMRSHAVTAAELKSLPGVGTRLARLAERIQPHQF